MQDSQEPHLIIVGGGPGGYTAAFHAARSGARVTLVEKDRLGGACLHTGCIPTKTFKSTAQILEITKRHGEFGLTVSPPSSFAVDMGALLARKEKIRNILCSGLEKTCAALKIQLLRGRAELQPKRQVLVHTAEGANVLSGDAIILATGSKILNLPDAPVDHKYILNSDDALALPHIPKSLLVVGGGVIGCELAFIFHEFGAKVTIVEGLDRLLPIASIDEEISRLLLREAKKRGISTLTAKTVHSATIINGRVKCLLGPSPFMQNADSETVEVETEAVLVAAGRVANTEDLNLEAGGIAVDAKGWIIADATMRTSADGIYAVGDALGPKRPMLAHTAAAEGLCAVDNSLGKKTVMDYRAIPSAIFTSPEIGIVGLSESQAQKQGIKIRSSLTQYRELGKSHAMNELPGFFKLVCEEKSGKILGTHIIGSHATEIVAEAALAIQHGLSAADIAQTVHAHPTLSEGLREAAQSWITAV